MTSIGYAVIDLETTGLDPDFDRVVECAVIQLDQDAMVVDEWSSLINVPDKHVIGARQIHGISKRMLVAAPSFNEIIGSIIARLQDRVVVGHVLEFDLAHLKNEFGRAGYCFPELTTMGLCTRELVSDQLERGHRSLASCCRAFEIAYPNSHTALGDARATAQLFRYCLERGLAIPPATTVHDAINWPEVSINDALTLTRADHAPDRRRLAALGEQLLRRFGLGGFLRR